MVIQWITRVLKEPVDWLKNTVYVIKSKAPGKVYIKVTGFDGSPSELKVQGTLIGVYTAIADLPTYADEYDMAGVVEDGEILLYVYNGSEWKPLNNLKDYIDGLVKWGRKDF